MKRSEINAIMRRSDDFIRSFGFILPPFAYWTADDYRRHGAAAAGIRSARLGWDITDYGLGDYDKTGLFLFTVRNGRLGDLARGRGMLYAEKIMIVKDRQYCPMHRHNLKAEDIINRGGGTLAIELFMSAPDGSLDPKVSVEVPTDGLVRQLPAGGVLRLAPGESVTLLPGVWHAFWGEDRDVLVGEVSTVNDDLTDNVFADPIGRFPDIDEDVDPWHFLVGDYDKFLGAA